MTRSAHETKTRNDRALRDRLRLSGPQREIEHHAMRLRAAVHISDYECLELERALVSLGECEVLPLKLVPNIPFADLIHARTAGYHIGAFAKHIGEKLHIVFNDAHAPNLVRVNVMEELFHIRLGHKPDMVHLVPLDGQHRTHDESKENEAYGCAIASLVPFAGLHAMLSAQVHVSRIAEHFAVPVDVVHERIGATNLGNLANARMRQLALMPIEILDLALVDEGYGRRNMSSTD